MPETGAHVAITGRVQGVGFRDFAARVARELNVSGWVRNSRDGNVEIEIEGDKDRVEQFVRRMHDGPSGAHVTGVEVSWLPALGRFRDFSIDF